VEHDEAAIEQFAHLEGQPGVGAGAAQRRGAGPDADGIVAGDDAAIAATEHERQIGRGAAPHGLLDRGGFAEAAVEVGDELGQVGRGRLDGGDAADPELADEAILQRRPEALDAPLGLRRVSGDVGDAEILQHAAQVGRELAAGQFLGDRPMAIVADEQVQPVAIDGQGQAMGGEQLLEQRGIAVDVLSRAELQGQDLARRVVDGAQEHERRPLGAEPGKGAAVNLHQRAPGGLGDAAVAAPGRAAPMARGQAQLAAQAANGLAADEQPMLLAQLLRQMAVIEADVHRRHQLGDRLP
jgi:hypothetical protein